MRTSIPVTPKWRLFGYAADPEGVLDLNLGEIKAPCSLHLNYTTETGGSIRVELTDTDGYGLDDAVPLEGSAIAAPAAWKTGTTIPARPGKLTIARLHMERATAWAYEVQTS